MIKQGTNSTDEDCSSAARHGVGEHTSSAVCVNLSKLWKWVASMIELYGVFYKLITITTNYYNCLCCQLPNKPLLAEISKFQCTDSIWGMGSFSQVILPFLNDSVVK